MIFWSYRTAPAGAVNFCFASYCLIVLVNLFRYFVIVLSKPRNLIKDLIKDFWSRECTRSMQSLVILFNAIVLLCCVFSSSSKATDNEFWHMLLRSWSGGVKGWMKSADEVSSVRLSAASLKARRITGSTPHSRSRLMRSARYICTIAAGMIDTANERQ